MKKLFALLLALYLFMSLSLSVVAEQAQATPDAQAVEDVEEWLFSDDEWLQEDFEEIDPALFEDVEGEFAEGEDTMEDTLLGAMEVYSWFVLYPLDTDTTKPNAAGDKHQVLDERFNTMEKLSTFVHSYFSDEIALELLGMGIYTEENGLLYAGDEGRHIDETIGETEFTVLEETEDQVTYQVRVHYWGSEIPEEEVFTYVRTLIDGEWKFTQFPFFW